MPHNILLQIDTQIHKICEYNIYEENNNHLDNWFDIQFVQLAHLYHSFALISASKLSDGNGVELSFNVMF